MDCLLPLPRPGGGLHSRGFFCNSFIVTTSQDTVNAGNTDMSSNEYTDYTSFHTEDETESDQEIKEYIEEHLYDSDE